MTLVDLLPFAAIAAVFWLLIIRPASARRKAQARLVASLTPGQRIMTTAGVFGTLVAREGERISLEIAPGVVIEMVALAVAQVVPADPATQPDAPSALAEPASEPEPPVELEPAGGPEAAEGPEAAADHEAAGDPEAASDLEAAPEPEAAADAEQAADRG